MHMPLWDNTPMKPFWVSDSTFTFWPYLLCWATALFCASVCVCVYLKFVYECAYSPPTHLDSRVIRGNPPSEYV